MTMTHSEENFRPLDQSAIDDAIQLFFQEAKDAGKAFDNGEMRALSFRDFGIDRRPGIVYCLSGRVVEKEDGTKLPVFTLAVSENASPFVEKEARIDIQNTLEGYLLNHILAVDADNENEASPLTPR